MDVMFSSSIPSALLPALAFGFFTPSFDYVSPVSLRTSSPPPNIPISKYYFQPHLEAIKGKFEEVRALGGAAAEEWFKGLENTGKEKLADALRWEQWDHEGGLQKMLALRVQKLNSSPLPQALPSPPPQLGTHVNASGQQQCEDLDTGPLFDVSSTSMAPPTHTSHPSGPAPITNHNTATQYSPFLQRTPDYVFPNYSGPPGMTHAMPPVTAPGQIPSKPNSYHNFSPPGTMQYGAQIPPPPGVTQPFNHLPPKPVTPMQPMNPGPPPGAQYIPYQAQQMGPRPIPMQIPIQQPASQPRQERSIRDVNEAKSQRKSEIERRCLELDPPIRPTTLLHMQSFAAAVQIPMALTEPAWEVLKPRLIAQKEEAEAREKEQQKQNEIMRARAEERRRQEAQLQAAKDNLDRQWEEMQQPLRNKLNHYSDEISSLMWNGGRVVNKENAPQFAADTLTYVRQRFFQMQEYEDGLMFAAGRPIQQDVPGAAPTRKLLLENMKWVYETKVKPITEVFSKEIFLCNGCGNGNKWYGFEAVVQHYAAKHTNTLSNGSVVVHWKADWPEEPPFDPDPIKQPPALAAVIQAAQHVFHHTTRHDQTNSHGSFGPISNGFSQVSTYQHDRSNSVSDGYNIQQFTVDLQSPSTHVPAWPNSQSSQPLPRPSLAPHLGAPGQPFGIYQVQLEELSKYAREIFDGTAAVKDFPNNLRIHVIIHHVVLRFKDRFTNEPNLPLFTDALNNSSQMKTLRNLNNLECKSCSYALKQDETVPYVETLYTLPALLSHFQASHIEHSKASAVPSNGVESPRLDWKFDMIKLPDENEINKLIDAPGMNDAKLRIVATVLPGVFPSPLPKIGDRPPYVDPAEPITSGAGQDLGQSLLGGAQFLRRPASTGIEVSVDNFPKFVEAAPPDEDDSPEPAGDDEYDPHRPAYKEPTPGTFNRFHHSKHHSNDGRSTATTTLAQVRAEKIGTDGQSGRPLKSTLSAAEQFLNDFDANEDKDAYEPPEHITPVSLPPGSQDQSSSQLDIASVPIPSQIPSNWPPPTISHTTSSDWDQRTFLSSSANLPLQPDLERRHTRPVSGGYERQSQYPEDAYAYNLHDRYRKGAHFEDYNAHRQRHLDHTSHSPQARPPIPSDGGYYQNIIGSGERQPYYSNQHVVQDRDYPGPSQQIQYVQETRPPQYLERGLGQAYEGQVEYIRVPAPRHAPEPVPYYLEQRQAQPSGQYIYEEALYEHNGQLYRRSQIPDDGRAQRSYHH